MVQPDNMMVHSGNGSQAVADFLRSGDIYLAPSRYEPASNAVLEALSCGLPVLYQEGSSHGDLVGGAGIGFESTGLELLKRLDALAENYDQHVQAIDVPSIQDVSRQYLSVMRWCFYMKRLLP
jgi:glycosyltransferase involved in cell wall biosynthesis